MKTQYKLLGLSKLDIAAIRAVTPEEKVEIEQVEYNPKKSNELMTLALIGGLGLLSSAAGYLFGKQKSEEVYLDVEVSSPSGDIKRIRLKIVRTENEPVDTQIMSQIKAALGA